MQRCEPWAVSRRCAQRSWSARSAWCSATSAPARSTRSRPCSIPATRIPCRSPRTTCTASCRLIFWSVMIIVTLTYVTLVMRADNDGEGGIMALITLLRRWTGTRGRRTAMMLAALGLFGAALFFGDSMITPAISVLSAVEGLKVIEPDFEDFDRADHRGDHRGAVLRPAARHRGRRTVLRAGDDRLVRGDRRVRSARASSTTPRSSRRCRRPTR